MEELQLVPQEPHVASAVLKLASQPLEALLSQVP
jgi:hypothetical protein